MIVSDIVQNHALWNAERIAVICREKKITYRELSARVKKLAYVLHGMGLGRGGHVGVLSGNSHEYVEIVFALAYLGAVWVPINFRLAVDEVAYILHDSQSDFLLYSPEYEDVALRAVKKSGDCLVTLQVCDERGSVYADRIALADELPYVPIASDDIFSIMYTSGTTGRPKGVVLTHRQFISGCYYLSAAVGATGNDVKLQAIPQFHAGGAIYQMTFLLVGATIVVLPRFDTDVVWRLIRQHQVTVAGFVPSMLVALSDSAGDHASTIPLLKKIMYGGSSISPQVLRKFLESFEIEFFQTYGQTEAGVIVTVLDDRAHRKAMFSGQPRLLESCGMPILGYRVRILENAADGGNAAGELCVASDSVMRGYWNQTQATSETLNDGWLHTGDMATVDKDGYYYILGRKADLIITGGENVYALEVENILLEHPDVLEAAVVGLEDVKWGEMIVAAVVPMRGKRLTADQLKRFCKGKIGNFKIPKIIRIVDALPKNASGKILKYVLKKDMRSV